MLPTLLRRPSVAVLVVVVGAVGGYVAWRMGPGERGPDTIYNEQTVEVMRRVMGPASNGVDVGAFEGTLTEPMVTVAPRGHHIAVEPQPEYARRLAQRFPAVRVVQAALADTVGSMDFTQALDDPARSGFGPQDYPTAAERTRQITVPVTCLDSIVGAGEPVSFIKIDVEGAEYRVLRGARATIRRDRPAIVFEYGAAGRFYSRVTPQMMWELVHDELALEIAPMRTWLDGGPAMTRPEFVKAVSESSDWMFLAYSPERHASANPSSPGR